MESLGTYNIGLIMAMIAGVVELAKTIEREGVKWPMLLSAGLGVVLGWLYQLSIAVPHGLAGWLQTGVYALLLGLAVSGFYDRAKQAGRAALPWLGNREG